MVMLDKSETDSSLIHALITHDMICYELLQFIIEMISLYGNFKGYKIDSLSKKNDILFLGSQPFTLI